MQERPFLSRIEGSKDKHSRKEAGGIEQRRKDSDNKATVKGIIIQMQGGRSCSAGRNPIVVVGLFFPPYYLLH